MPREGNVTVRFQYCTTESVGVLSRFRCLLQIRGRCAVDPTSSERVKTFPYMRSNDDFRFHFQYTSTTIGGLVEQQRMVALVPKVPLRKQSSNMREVCHGVPQYIVLVCVPAPFFIICSGRRVSCYTFVPFYIFNLKRPGGG